MFKTLVLVGLLAAAGIAQPLNTDVVWTRMGDHMKAFSVVTGGVVFDAPGVPGGGWGIAIDPHRNVWSTDYSLGQNTIRKFTLEGIPVGTYVAGPASGAGTSTVGPVAIDRNGYVYVGNPDPNGNQITKLDNNGNFVTSWNAVGLSVRDIDIDVNGDIWVLTYYSSFSTGLSHVEKFTPGGTQVFHWVVQSATANALYCDEWGRVFVTHAPSFPTYSILNLQGSVIGSGTTPSFRDLGNIHVAPNGRVWVVEFFGGDALEVFSASNTLVSTYPLSTAGSALGVDARGNVWLETYSFTAGTPLSLEVRGADGVLRQTINAGTSSANGYSYNFGDITGMTMARTVDPTGDLDGDGYTNQDEVQAGSSPLDPYSVPVSFVLGNVPRIGTQLQIGLTCQNGQNLGYFMPWSLNPSTIPMRYINPLDGRALPISIFSAGSFSMLDPIYELSSSGTYPGNLVFPDVAGILDTNGLAVVRLNIPNLPLLVGVTIHAGCAVLDSTALSGAKFLSNRLSLTFVP